MDAFISLQTIDLCLQCSISIPAVWLSFLDGVSPPCVVKDRQVGGGCTLLADYVCILAVQVVALAAGTSLWLSCGYWLGSSRVVHPYAPLSLRPCTPPDPAAAMYVSQLQTGPAEVAQGACAGFACAPAGCVPEALAEPRLLKPRGEQMSEPKLLPIIMTWTFYEQQLFIITCKWAPSACCFTACTSPECFILIALPEDLLTGWKSPGQDAVHTWLP